MILSTSDIDSGRKRLLRYAAGCLCAALFLAGAGAVYEHFSYGVYSGFMVYAFVYPLIAGLLLVLAASGKAAVSSRTLFLLLACTAACTAGSITAGIIRISGREHALLIVYPVLGGLLGLLTLLSHLLSRKQGSSAAS